MGFGPLRVINEDRVAAGTGFGTHGHRDMEILSYVLEGALAHRDDIGNGSTIRPGDVQRMSAGRGVQHSEFNGSSSRPVHFLQIWIVPDASGTGIAPEYEEKRFEAAQKRGRLRLIASRGGDDGSVRIHQDVRVYAGLFEGEEQARLEVAPGRRLYVHVARGRISANGETLAAGDALKLAGASTVELTRGEAAEVLVFDLPGGGG
jgi:redox-sensitive bicupin YhaK (pirin superfamily)